MSTQTRPRVAQSGAALFVVIAMIWGASPAAAESDSLSVVTADVSHYPEIEVVVATPGLGEHDADAISFQVFERGQEQRVAVEALAVNPLELTLVVDTSGSMRGAPLLAAKDAARSFLTQLPASAAVSVIGFGAVPSQLSVRSTDHQAQISAVDGLQAAGETALYDAVQLALSGLSGEEGVLQAMVVLSDGGDTASQSTLEETAEAVAGAGVALFAVDLRTPGSSPEALATLASIPTGQVMSAEDPSALTGVFDQITDQLVRQFALTWSTQAAGSTHVDIVLETRGTRATARHHLELPPMSPGREVTDAGQAGSSPNASGTWLLVAGVALAFAAMLVSALRLLVFRSPRARGLGRGPQRFGLASTAARAEQLGDGVLRRRGAAVALSDALDAAGLEIRPGEVVVVVSVGSAVALTGGWLLGSLVVAVVLAAAVPAVARAVLGRLAHRRRSRFVEQLGETLQMLAGSLRAGHGLAQSMDTVAREAESPTSEEFRRLTVETRLGRDLSEALEALAMRMQSSDFEWVVQAVNIHREVGGDLAEIFESVAGTIADRNRLRRQVSALTAEGRLSGWVLMAIPFAVGAMMAITNPTYLEVLFTTAKGLVLLALGAVLMTAGGVWLRRIARPVF